MMMIDLNAWRQLAEATDLPASLDLVQTDVRWCTEPEWISTRNRIDARIFRAFLEGAPGSFTVRRIVLLGVLPADVRPARHKDVVAEHLAWVRGLVRDLHYLGMLEQGAQAPYRLRQLVLGRRGSRAIPADDISEADSTAAGSQTFELLWARTDVIANNVQIVQLATGPYADRDPRRNIW